MSARVGRMLVSAARVGDRVRNPLAQWIINGSGIRIVAYDGTYPGRDGDPYTERILRERLINRCAALLRRINREGRPRHKDRQQRVALQTG